MLEHIPFYITCTFGLTLLLTLVLIFLALKKSNSAKLRSQTCNILTALLLWIIIQSVLTLKHIYSGHVDFFPPTILLFGIAPAIFTIISLFITKRGRQLVDSLPLQNLTYLHVVRVTVELVLYWLFLNKAIPELMTFSGRNFDIIAGITAPLIVYFGIIKEKISKWSILVWNVICMGLLINIMINAFLSAPSPVQQFAFEQPNIAILHFPFSLLPTFIVPVVLFGHLAAIRQLLYLKQLRKTK